MAAFGVSIIDVPVSPISEVGRRVGCVAHTLFERKRDQVARMHAVSDRLVLPLPAGCAYYIDTSPL